MNRTDPFLVAVGLVVFVAAYGGLSWMAGGLYLDTHEGDSYHLLDILTRMKGGAVPHIDFVTPLGALAFWPVTWIMDQGLSIGHALILAQWAVAVCLLPFVLYAGVTRLTRGLAAYFGCVVLGLVLALSYGTATSGVGISMHYNRWAWAVAFVLLLIVLVPARRERPGVDGVVIGLLSTALLLLKVTYFVTLVPAVIIALVVARNFTALIAAAITGLAVVLAVAISQGLAFWTGYFGDLLVVSRSVIRPYAGAPLSEIIAGPSHIAATLVGIVAVLMIRKVAPPATGIAVLLVVPAFIYISYQNFGTDPQWLIFLPVLLLALRPEAGMGEVFGVETRFAMTAVAIAAFAVFFPSLFNIATSPVAHLSFDKTRFLPMVPEGGGDLYVRRDRAYMMTAQVFKDQEPGPWAGYAEKVGRPEVTAFQGITFESCEFQAGSRGMLETLGADLADAGLPEGSTLLVADLLSAYHLFAPVEPPQGSAPWYYGGLTGLDDTDYVMVPKCAFTAGVRRIVLGELETSGAVFTLVRDNALYALFAVGER